MFTPENKQKDFFDSYVYDRRVKDDHELMIIKREIDWAFVEEKTRKLYCANNGRPGYSPIVLFRMLFIEFYANLSDTKVYEECTYNLLYQKFIGIGMDDEIPEPTTLVEYRKRLGEDIFKELFKELVKQLKAKGILSEKVAAMDATHIEADVGVPSMVNLLRQGRRKIMWRMGKRDKEWQEKLMKKYPSEALKLFGKASEEKIREEQERTKEFLKELKSYELNEEMELDAEELEKLSLGEWGLVSFEDIDARWGHKSKEKKFGGFKIHASMDESGIVTSAETMSGEKNEATKLDDLIQEDRSKGIKSECVAVDGLYDNAPTYTVGEDNEIPIYAYVDLIDGDKKRYNFYAQDCQGCLSKGSCLKKGAVQRSIWLNKCCEESMRQDKIKRQEALEKRKRIEAKFGEAKKWHLLNRARYRGRLKVSIQALMTFFVMNAKRMVKLVQQTHSPPGSLKRVLS